MCCLKPLGLWKLVTAATGNEYSVRLTSLTGQGQACPGGQGGAGTGHHSVVGEDPMIWGVSSTPSGSPQSPGFEELFF